MWYIIFRTDNPPLCDPTRHTRTKFWPPRDGALSAVAQRCRSSTTYIYNYNIQTGWMHQSVRRSIPGYSLKDNRVRSKQTRIAGADVSNTFSPQSCKANQHRSTGSQWHHKWFPSCIHISLDCRSHTQGFWMESGVFNWEKGPGGGDVEHIGLHGISV